MRPVLLVPGIGNSGPAHWQSLWEAKHPAVARVMQRDTLPPFSWRFPIRPGPISRAAPSGFTPVPRALRDHPVTVVSSDDDPYASAAFTDAQVAASSAEHVRLSGRGHINAASGIGDWPDGWALIERWR